MSDVEVTKNADLSRYEAHLEGKLAGYADYEVQGDVVSFPHTVTEPEFGGRGVASAIARTSLDEARAAGHSVRPACEFYADWIDKRPEYQDLLA